MAKRSVRKQRRAGEAPPRPASTSAPAPAATHAPVWRTRAFWLGGAVVGLLAAVLALAAGLALGGDDDGPAAAATPTATPAPGVPTEEELQTQFEERDREQIEDLTTQAEQIAQDLQPVMRALERAVPRAGGTPPQAADAEVEQWLTTARNAAEPYQESISGSTEHNVARNAVRGALDTLVNAIETYRLAGRPGADRAAVLRQAARQRDNAIRLWSTAGIQIDATNIAAGFGHQHVSQLGGAAAGAQPPDTLPEGTDARPEE